MSGQTNNFLIIIGTFINQGVVPICRSSVERASGVPTPTVHHPNLSRSDYLAVDNSAPDAHTIHVTSNLQRRR